MFPIGPDPIRPQPYPQAFGGFEVGRGGRSDPPSCVSVAVKRKKWRSESFDQSDDGVAHRVSHNMGFVVENGIHTKASTSRIMVLHEKMCKTVLHTGPLIINIVALI